VEVEIPVQAAFWLHVLPFKEIVINLMTVTELRHYSAVRNDDDDNDDDDNNVLI